MRIPIKSRAVFERARAGIGIIKTEECLPTSAEAWIEVGQDTVEFLTAYLFNCEPDSAHEDENQDLNLKGKTIYDFAPEIYAGVENFCSEFRDYLEARGIGYAETDTLQRSFGGSVYFSLSGAGCGFFDEAGELGDVIQKHLDKFSGNHYRFQEMDMSVDEDGCLDLCYLPDYVDEYRDKLFRTPTPEERSEDGRVFTCDRCGNIFPTDEFHGVSRNKKDIICVYCREMEET